MKIQLVALLLIFGAYKMHINAFLDNFWETFLNYDQLGERHSPVYIMLLSAFLSSKYSRKYN